MAVEHMIESAGSTETPKMHASKKDQPKIVDAPVASESEEEEEEEEEEMDDAQDGTFDITAEMAKEEDDLTARHKKEEEERARQARQSYYSQSKSSRVAKQDRLSSLLDKTSQYSEFIARALMDARARLETEEKEGKAQPAPPRKRKAEEEEETPAVKKPKRGRKKKSEEEVAEEEAEQAQMKEEAKQGEGLRERAQPRMVTGGQLRDYQLQGIVWLASLYENGLNGILADEMGLGKTVQTLGFIARCLERNVRGPFIIVAPLSTLSNWMQEIARWTPDIDAVLYHGNPQDRTELRETKINRPRKELRKTIIVTSFEIAMKDVAFLSPIKFTYMAIDEGHRLKNMNCRLIRELKTYNVDNKVLLSGTPLQNNLTELWSLLNFLMPSIFNSLDEFNDWFSMDAIFEEGGNAKVMQEQMAQGLVTKLHGILRPFLLRRTKQDVESELPKKKEYLVFAPLAPLQRAFYDAALHGKLRQFVDERHGITPKEEEDALTEEELAKLDHATRKERLRNGNVKDYRELSDTAYLKKVEEDADAAAAAEKTEKKEEARPKKSTQSLQHTLMQLRKVCNHPLLFDDPEEVSFVTSPDLIDGCGKIELLDRLLPALFERGHRVLIFSQMTKVLNILEDYLRLRGHDFCRIDGSVPQADRQEEIARFNRDDSVKVFILSTRAGGLGLNLTSADTVIIYDSDWNPQMDLQAQDRVHRIGQTKPVLVYRFVTAHSVESRILDRASAKRRLERVVIQKGTFKTHKGMFAYDSKSEPSITLDELADMLAEDAEEIGGASLSDEEEEEEATAKNGKRGKAASKKAEKRRLARAQRVISDAELAHILDRSPAAFARKKSATDTKKEAATEEEVEEGQAGKSFKEVTTTMQPKSHLLQGITAE